MTGVIATLPTFQFSNALGLPMAGGTLTSYLAGTTTLANTYQDQALTSANTNPIALDSRGECTLWLDSTKTYKFVLKNALGVVQWTVDNITNSTAFAQAVKDDLTAFQVSLAAPTGSAMVGYQSPGSASTTVQTKLRESVSVKDFGAVGDGVADDAASIQAALDYMGSTGGGTVQLVKTSGRYRITTGLKIPSFVTLEGISSNRYPFNGSSQSSCLLADFTNIYQWVIEAETTVAGLPVAHNAIISGSLPSGAVYDPSVKNLSIQVVNTTPYGGVRMHGSPGAVVDNVSVIGTGIGLLVNYTFGGEFKIQTRSLYYGTVIWGDANANTFDIYNSQLPPNSKTTPAAYQLPYMTALSSLMVSTLKLSVDHSNRCFGLVIGADYPTTSASNTISVTNEYFSGGVFQYSSFGTAFARLYVEAESSQADYGIVSARSRFSALNVHPFLSGAGALFDLGIDLKADLCLTGTPSYAQFGNGPFADGSTLIITGNTATNLALTTNRKNIFFPSDQGVWTNPTLSNSWLNAGGVWADVSYRRNPRSGLVELRGLILGGDLGLPAFTLPAGMRPANKRQFAVIGTGATAALSAIIVTNDGSVVPIAPSTPSNGLTLDGVTFESEV